MSDCAIVNGWPNDDLCRYMRRTCWNLTRGLTLDWEDLYHDAVLELFRVAHKCDPARGRAELFAVWSCRSAKRRAMIARRRCTCVPLRLRDPDRRSAGPAAEAEKWDGITVILSRVSTLPDRDRQLVTRRFGLDGGDPARTDDLADGACLATVRNRLKQVLDRLSKPPSKVSPPVEAPAPPPAPPVVVPLRELASTMDQLRAVLDYRRGRSVQEIADRLGVTVAVVLLVLTKHGAMADPPAVVAR